jgi:hypothetical protein
MKTAFVGLSLCSFSALAQDQMAFWNFNGQNLFVDNSLINADVTGDDVSGTAGLRMLNQIINVGGVDGTGYTDSEGVNHTGGKAASWGDIKGSGADAEFIIEMSTTDWENIALRFDYKSQLADSYDLAVSMNEGDSWHKLANNLPLDIDYSNWSTATVNLSTLGNDNDEEGPVVLENRESLWIRIDDLAQNGNDAFDFDNVEVTGSYNNNQLPIVEFAQKNQLVPEGVGSVDVVLELVNPNTSPVVVTFEIDGAESTATLNSDFSIASPYTVTFPAGSDTDQSFSVNIIDDSDEEATEKLELNIISVSNGQINSEDLHRIRIADNDTEIPELFINEVLAKNINSYADENAEYDDWIEIYNPNLFAVDLADYMMKDGVDTYTFPQGSEATVIAPSNFIVIWADGQSGQGPLHTNFKLSSTGEFVGLYAPDGTTEIDAVTYPEILDDTSYGRETDGGSNWVVFDQSDVTPNASNGIIISVDENNVAEFSVYPNPVEEGVLYFSAPMKVSLYNILGAKVLDSHQQVQQIDLSTLEKGYYLLESESGFVRKILIK